MQVNMGINPPSLPEGSQALCLLDGPYVVDEGRRVLVPEGGERLLVFVALRNGHAVSRRKIAGTLWPTAGEERAAGNLRTALWRLRSSGIAILDADKRALSVKSGTFVDVLDLYAWGGRLMDGSATQADLDITHLHPEATDLLPGWYDDWIIFERERLRQRLLHALEILSRRLAQEGRFGEAVEAAVTATSIEPLRESAQRSLIAVHLLEGNLAEARRAFQAYADLLQAELAIAPADDLERLVLRFREPVSAVQ